MQARNNIRTQFVYCMWIAANIFMGSLYAEEAVEIEKKSSDAIIKFIKNYSNGCFTYIADGPFSYLPLGADFGVWVTAKTKETTESGRILALTFLNDYLSELQTNKDTSKWHQTLYEEDPRWYSANLNLKNIGIRMVFWDENVDRPKAPYLAEIDFYDGKFKYYEADPKTQALKLILEESYEDAVKHLTSADK